MLRKLRRKMHGRWTNSAGRRSSRKRPRLGIEALEPRQMLAVITVDSLADDTVADGMITLREAIIAANNDAVADPVENTQTGNGDDTIQFVSSLDGGTISLTLLDALDADFVSRLIITETLTINASSLSSGITINANGSQNDRVRVLGIYGDTQQITTVTLVGLTLTGGWIDNDRGGAILSMDASLTVRDSVITGNLSTSGGGIYAVVNSGPTDASPRELRIESSVIANNSAIFSTTSGWGNGGGIDVRASTSAGLPQNGLPSAVRIIDSRISNNTAEGLGGGAYIWAVESRVEVDGGTITENQATAPGGKGGGLYVYVKDGYDEAKMTLSNSTLSGNRADEKGGGVYLSAIDGDVEIADSTFDNNRLYYAGSSRGGGLYSYLRAFSSGSGGSNLTITGSTISNNSAASPTSEGGGVFICIKFNDNTFNVTNSTISGNRSGSEGGGLFFGAYYPLSSSLQGTLTNVTISDNVSDPPVSGGGLFTQDSSNIDISVRNSILSGNRDNVGNPNNVGGRYLVDTSSYNLVGTGGDGGLQPDVNGNKVGAAYDDPRLFPLADFGGPTLTHALLPDSPAIDGGHPGDQAGVAGFPLFDQRGTPFNRVEGQSVDIGAYELQGGPFAPSGFPRVIAVIVSGSISNHAPFSIPGGSGEQLKTVPVGGADTITVWFDRDVAVQEAAATLTGNVTGQPVPIAPVSSGFTSGPNWGTWQFPTFLAETILGDMVLGDMMELTVDATLVQDAATQEEMLDGDWIDNIGGDWFGNPKTIFDDQSAMFPSGDGTEGGDFVFDFTILPGDANRDNVVGLADLAIMQKHYDPATEQVGGFAFRTGDFDGDGKKMNQEDYVGLFSPNIHKVFVLWGKELEVGDMDTDLGIDFDDIDGWVAALTDQYFATYGDLLFAGLDEATVDLIVEKAIGDIDDDGDNDFDDTPLFVSLLMNNGWSKLFPGSL